jgi:hypothetical protein
MMSALDPIGPENDQQLDDLFSRSAAFGVPVLAAWGANGDHLRRASAVKGLARAIGAKFVCLGVTKEGHPRHPLYVKGDQPLVSFGQPA